MAIHEVHVEVPSRELGKSDVRFKVWEDGTLLGTLAISKGAVVWYPNGTTYGCKVSWAKFDELMQNNGRRAEPRS
jgi:hypothetical protein